MANLGVRPQAGLFGTERHETYMDVGADTISVTESSIDEKGVVYDQNEYEMTYALPDNDTLSYTQNGLADTMTFVRTGDFLVLDTERNAFTKE